MIGEPCDGTPCRQCELHPDGKLRHTTANAPPAVAPPEARTIPVAGLDETVHCKTVGEMKAFLERYPKAKAFAAMLNAVGESDTSMPRGGVTFVPK